LLLLYLFPDDKKPGAVFWSLLVVPQPPHVGECLEAVVTLVLGGVLHLVLCQVLLPGVGLEADVTSKRIASWCLITLKSLLLDVRNLGFVIVVQEIFNALLG